jgi:hypothetical protein
MQAGEGTTAAAREGATPRGAEHGGGGAVASSRAWRTLVDGIVRRAERTPYLHLDGYMERFWLLRTRWVSARVHRILRSDHDRDLHDHPWHYATVILRGGYWEVTDAGERWYGPGSVLVRRATHLHRLVLPAGQSTTTLFLHTRKRRAWGFRTERGWVDWRTYVAERGEALV